MKSRVNLNASKDRLGSQQIVFERLVRAYPALGRGHLTYRVSALEGLSKQISVWPGMRSPKKRADDSLPD